MIKKQNAIQYKLGQIVVKSKSKDQKGKGKTFEEDSK